MPGDCIAKPIMSRREFTALLGSGAVWPFARQLSAGDGGMNFRIRTITAGVQPQSVGDLEPAKAAVVFLKQARAAFETDGYEVQTLRLATQALHSYAPDWASPLSLQAIRTFDQFAEDNDVICSVGPVISGDHYHREFAQWCAALVQHTNRINFSCRIASPAHGLHVRALRSAAEAIQAITHASAGGEGNFRFAATAFVPSGTPFFPAAWFDRGNAFSIGLESANLLTDAFTGSRGLPESKRRLKKHLEAALGPVADRARTLAQSAAWRYLGIDVSPAPGLDASIGRAIETLTQAPIGSPSTLAACAAITDVLKSLEIQTCGYSGLMLPVLEDPVLARRAAEGRYGIDELLLYSSVCGTGLDVVPLPGDISVDELIGILADVAALATKYRKPLSARLFPIPGKHAGETVSFDNPYLTECKVMAPR